jgi:hypothetical protein
MILVFCEDIAQSVLMTGILEKVLPRDWLKDPSPVHYVAAPEKGSKILFGGDCGIT